MKLSSKKKEKTENKEKVDVQPEQKEENSSDVRNRIAKHYKISSNIIPIHPKNQDYIVGQRDQQTNAKHVIEKKELEAITYSLQQNYSDILIQAMTDASAVTKLKEIICNSPDFQNLPCYHNPDICGDIINEVAGYGIIEQLLHDYPNITDIGFNGRFLTIETPDNKFTYGLSKQDQAITSDYIEKIAKRFALREPGNGKQFNAGSPIFNGFSNNIRISATYKTLSPLGTTMSLRVSKPKLALNEINFDKFAPQFLYDILYSLVVCHCNIIISGEVGSGKTELQKLLIGAIPFSDKIIMIEDVAETHIADLYPDKDVYSWVTKGTEKGQDLSKAAQVTITDHIKNALRNNPKWIMISETRGSEAYEMFQSILSGHNIITTMHAISNNSVPGRFLGMCSLRYENVDLERLEEEFLNYVHIGIHLSKKIINGHVYRYLDNLSEFVPKSSKYPDGTNTLFEQRLDDNGYRTYSTNQPTEKLKNIIRNEIDAEFKMPNFHNVYEPIPTKTKLEEKEESEIQNTLQEATTSTANN